MPRNCTHTTQRPRFHPQTDWRNKIRPLRVFGYIPSIEEMRAALKDFSDIGLALLPALCIAFDAVVRAAASGFSAESVR
jgi:hypothetical protein